jgi:hypothetical protein
MTRHAARLYAVALAIVVFFLVWATVSARPWISEPAAPTATAAPSASTSELAALRARERALKKQIIAVRGILRSEAVQASLPPPQVASAPAQVVSAPPATVTRSS